MGSVKKINCCSRTGGNPVCFQGVDSGFRLIGLPVSLVIFPEDQINAVLFDRYPAEKSRMLSDNLKLPEITFVDLKILIIHMVQEDHGIFPLQLLQLLQENIALGLGKINPDIRFRRVKQRARNRRSPVGQKEVSGRNGDFPGWCG
jgi:hypothetical protein